MCAVGEVQSVKTAVSHCDGARGEMTLMTLLLKCKARVITALSLKARAVAAEENAEQSGNSVVEAAGVHTEHSTNCTGKPCCDYQSIYKRHLSLLEKNHILLFYNTESNVLFVTD